MAITTGPNLGLFDNGNLGEQHYTELMRFLRGIDLLVQPHVKSASIAVPPGSPVDGDAYVVASGASGAWSGQVGKIARWSTRLTTAAWEFITPKLNWSVAVDDATFSGQIIRYTGSAWVAQPHTPPTPAGLVQNATTIYGGTGVPNNADGANGGFYFRSDGGAGTRIYHKSGGTWSAFA